MVKSRIGLVLNRVMVLIIATHVGAARAEQAASEPSAADPKASAQEKQPREESAAASPEATLYPVPPCDAVDPAGEQTSVGHRHDERPGT